MTGSGGDTGRGLRVAARSVRTWNRISSLVVVVALVAGLAAGTWKTWNAASAYEWHLMGVYTLSEFLLAAGYKPDKTKKVRTEEGEVYVTTIGRIAEFERFHELRDRIVGDVSYGALLGAGIAAGLVIGTLVALRALGSGLRRGRRLRGGELASARELRKRAMSLPQRALLPFRPPEARPYAIAGIPWAKDAETLHTIVSGTTGSGKTVLISDLVEQIRRRGERCVIYDKMGSYTEAFFDPRRDVLLNPLDARTPRWSPFLEARTARDFDTMANALIPRQKDAADPFWITAARQLFSRGAAVLWQRGETRNRVLVDLLLKTELSELAEAMEGTVTQSIVDPANPKTALSVRAMLTANIGAMELLPDEGEAFSIREWIEREEGGGFLFLTSRGDQHASLRGLISTWLEIAVNAVLSLPRGDSRRIWVILDELPTLHQLPSLEPGLAESRQYGGCFVLGVQVFSALRDLYGRDGATTISGLCGTRVVLAAPDKDTSEWSAASLGNVEVETLSEGVSYETPRDGVTLSTRREERPLVLPSEVSRLENLSGYIKLPGASPVARIRLKYRKRGIVAARFTPKEDAGGSVGRPQTGTARVSGNGAEPGSSAEAAGSRVPAPAGHGAGEDKDETPAFIEDAGAGNGEEAERGEDAVLDTMEWTRGNESLPVPANDVHEEPGWLFEGYGPGADLHASPADASAAGRAGGGASAAPAPPGDGSGPAASGGEAPRSGGSAPPETGEGSAADAEDGSATEKPGRKTWL